MPNCMYCYRKTSGTNLCVLCANTLPPHHELWEFVEFGMDDDDEPWKAYGGSGGSTKSNKSSKGSGGSISVGTELALTLLPQPADKILGCSNSILKDNIPQWVGHMCIFLTSRDYWNAKSETSVGDQNTPKNCEVGTASLDFQGIRAGSEGTFWIDLQGQVGGGSSKRFSYCQCMIETCLGGPVPGERIIAALLQSLKGGQIRIVIHKQGGKGMPK